MTTGTNVSDQNAASASGYHRYRSKHGIWMSAGCILFLSAVAGWFFIYTQFVPVLNDIVSIYKIAALDDAGRWINGFYGPGYTLLYLLLGASMNRLALVYVILMLLSFIVTKQWLSMVMPHQAFIRAPKRMTDSSAKQKQEPNRLSALRSLFRLPALRSLFQSPAMPSLLRSPAMRSLMRSPAMLSLFFHLFLFAVLRSNYSDGIFIFVLSVGLMLFLQGILRDERQRAQTLHTKWLQWAGLLIAGSTILFRHHGLPFVAIFVIAFWLTSAQTPFGKSSLHENRLSERRAFYPYTGFSLKILLISGIMLLIPLACIFTASLFIPEVRPENWQHFNAYRFFHPVDWHRVDLLLDTSSYREFSLLSALIADPLKVVRSAAVALYHSAVPVFILTLLPAAAWLITRDRLQLTVFLTVLFFIPLILPGMERGIYPLYFTAFFSMVLLTRHSCRNVSILPIVFTLMLLVALGSLVHIIREGADLHEKNRYVKNELETVLTDWGVRDSSRIFTDDYNLWLFTFDNLEVRNFQGWRNLHPEFRQFHPNTVFKQQTFKEHGIFYVVYLRDGYIARQFPELPCNKHQTLDRHHICAL